MHFPVCLGMCIATVTYSQLGSSGWPHILATNGQLQAVYNAQEFLGINYNVTGAEPEQKF